MSSNKSFDNQIIENLKNRIKELQSDQTKNPIKRISNKKEIKKLQKELEQLKAKRSEKILIIGMAAFGAILALIIAVMSIKENAAGSNSQNDTELQIVQSVDNMATEDAETVAESVEGTETIEVTNTSNLLEEQESEDEIKKKAEEESAKIEEEAAKKKAEEEAAKIAEEEAAKRKAEEEAAKKAEEEAARKKAEEEAAAQKAAEEAATRQAAQQPDSSTVANGTEDANAKKVLEMGPTTGGTCWVPRNTDRKAKYHSNQNCSKMKDPIKTTVDTATACGYDACKKCYK